MYDAAKQRRCACGRSWATITVRPGVALYRCWLCWVRWRRRLQAAMVYRIEN